MAGQFTKPRSSAIERAVTSSCRPSAATSVNNSSFDAERPSSRSNPARPRVPPVGRHAEPAPHVREGRLRRPVAGARVEPGVRRREPRGRRYDSPRRRDRAGACASCAACGIDLEAELALHQVDIWTAHEALLLEYEEALTRQDSITGDWYDCSAHLLWVGERTRQPRRARRVPGRGAQPDRREARARRRRPRRSSRSASASNPRRLPGRIVLFSRMGADQVADTLPPLLRAVRQSQPPGAVGV